MENLDLELKSNGGISKKLYWAPRVLSILFILFLTMFSFDVFEPGLKWWEMAIGFLMHNIPVLVLTIALVISWRREIVGAVVFFVAGLLYIALILTNKHFEMVMLTWILFISGPAFIVAVLFLINWNKK